MITNIFEIKAIDPPWNGIHYSVTWPGRGPVITNQNRYTMITAAFETGDWSVGVESSNQEVVTINPSMVYDRHWSAEMVDHLFRPGSDIVSFGFSQRRYAESFVDRMEKHLMWKSLARVQLGHN